MHSIGAWWMWLVFAAIILVMLALDLVVFRGGRAHKVTVKEAAAWSIAWVSLSLLFCVGLWWYLNDTAGLAEANNTSALYLTAYVLEKSLSVDNVFVWIMIFSYFAIPAELQHRVLLYGIVGAIVLRTVMIFFGSWMIAEFNWILYLFGAFLLFTGVKMFMPEDDEKESLENNKLLLFLRRHIRVTDKLDGENFFVKHKGVLYATPLFLTMVLVEVSDVIFAVDSIPAVFALTTDPFIVLTSNLFAILGLRAMYFLVADIKDRFALLQYGLAIILSFIGIKMLISHWYHMPTMVSLSVVLGVLATSILLSILRDKHKQQE